MKSPSLISSELINMQYDKYLPIVRIVSGKNSHEIDQELLNSYSDKVPSLSTVQRWTREYDSLAGASIRVYRREHLELCQLRKMLLLCADSQRIFVRFQSEKSDN